MVASKDEITNKVGWKPVTELFQYEANRKTQALTLTNEKGGSETLEVTNNHPFHVIDKGWVDSGNLIPGMQVDSYQADPLTVLENRTLESTPVTYNFEVADFHTYFAGESEAWVHNTTGCACTHQITTSRVYHNKRQAEAAQEFSNSGLKVVDEVTILGADGKTRARADLYIEAVPGSSVQIPKNFEAYDLNGNKLTSIPLDPYGRALVEIKTGNAGLTKNQKMVYMDAAYGAGTGRGGNAANAKFNGRPPPTSVVVLFDI